MRTLVLNAGYEPLIVVSWQRAICLVFTDKVDVVENHSHMVRTIEEEYQLPSVVRLKRYIRLQNFSSRVRCTRQNVILRDGYRCQYCRIKLPMTQLTVDHIVPRSRGGRSSWTNLVAACKPCNRKKGSRTLESVGYKLKKPPKKPRWNELLVEKDREALALWGPYLSLKKR